MVRGGVHDHGDSSETDERTGDVMAVGAEPVEDHAPGQRAGHEDPAVGGEDAPEVGVVPEGGDEPVGGQRGDAGTDPGEPAVLAHPLPDHPGATDLGERGNREQEDRAEDGLGRAPYLSRVSARSP